MIVESVSTIFSVFFMHKNEASSGAFASTRTKVAR